MFKMLLKFLIMLINNEIMIDYFQSHNHLVSFIYLSPLLSLNDQTLKWCYPQINANIYQHKKDRCYWLSDFKIILKNWEKLLKMDVMHYAVLCVNINKCLIQKVQTQTQARTFGQVEFKFWEINLNCYDILFSSPNFNDFLKDNCKVFSQNSFI